MRPDIYRKYFHISHHNYDFKKKFNEIRLTPYPTNEPPS